MTRLGKTIVIGLTAAFLGVVIAVVWVHQRYGGVPGIDRSRPVGLVKTRERLRRELADIDLRLGDPVFMRIFKETSELEIWLRRDGAAPWTHFRTYAICNYSGDLGPKLKEGDRQSPEGLYRVGADQLNPNSSYHLSFNLGFPNAFDRAQGRTGSFLMVHGDCVSIGCYAMTDAGIEEIYALAEAALAAGEDAFRVHAFPARLDDAWLARQAASPWHGFWRDLKPCYDRFERDGVVPDERVIDGRYACG